MTKYEFKVLSTDVRSAEEELRGFGADGWQLVAATEASPMIVRLFLQRSISGGTLTMLGE